MKIDHPSLSIPIYLKLDPNQPWPDDKVFYYLTADGMFLCRNNPFFRSSSKTTKLPKGLAPHTGSMHLDFPLISREQMEQVVGFFDAIWKLHNSEAAVLLVWNTETKQVEIECPPQVATVSGGYTSWKGEKMRGSPMDVKYEIPQLPAHKLIFGDIHSHVEMGAFASGMDTADEATKPGVHIVVGKIHEEPPEFHIESTADGNRFSIDKLTDVSEGYELRRGDFPPGWIDQVEVQTYKYKPYSGSHGGGYYSGYGGEGYYDRHDKGRVDSSDDGWVKKDGYWVKETPKAHKQKAEKKEGKKGGWTAPWKRKH